MAEPSTNFSAALKVWGDINLHELQKVLDKQGLEIVENQKENMVGRKKLAEQTREFKKVPDESKGPAFKTLLKAYQGEIDNLTRRSKVAESAFLNLYKLLAEAPDPFPLLDAAVDQTARASEARVLELEVARQKEEVASLKQQLSETQTLEKERRKLSDKVEKLETKMADLIRDNVAAKEAEMHATYDERLRNYEEREKDLQRQVTVARSQLRELRTTADSSEAKLFDQSLRQDQETIARLAEADLTAQDLERANSRVAEVERRNEKLRAEIEAVRSGSESAGRVIVLETQVSDLQAEATRLITALDEQKATARAERGKSERKVDDLTKDKAARIQEIEELRQRLKQYADYDELKRELEIMKYVEFAGMDLDGQMDDEDADGVHMPDPNADKANLQRAESLEGLLMSKNRKLQDEVTSMRVAHEELTAAHRTLSADIEALQSRFEEQRSLNERLENDLLRINKTGTAGAPTVAAKEDPLAGLNLGRKDVTSNGALPAVQSSAEISILPIITSQRDRFRQRNAELEEELRRQFETISELRNEIKSLQGDNLKLYEKVRYLQSYRDDATGAIKASTGFHSTVRIDEELGKYQNKYEESMNPFEAFRGRERGRAIHMLNPIERILLHLSNIVLGNRLMRNIFVVYACVLHFIVLSSLYSNMTTAESLKDVSSPAPPIG
ncbi:hypothetical protein OIO90_003607 [Microbotryomycetes sp. JL221]|nr:hypothetical protein OIO90_003607 [Microbotryomycetes sp. JL221]